MDRRIKYTKKIIKDTFISLLSQKDISKITVCEICKIADINRATFYRYYNDTYDLLDKIEQDFTNELKKTYQEENINEKSIFSFSSNMLTIFIKNKELVKILFSTNNNIYFLNEVLEIAYEKCKTKWEHEVPNITEEEIESASIFIFNGALGIVNFWVKNDFDKDVNEISKIISELSYYGTRHYIYKK